jgi:hypothetical protein
MFRNGTSKKIPAEIPELVITPSHGLEKILSTQCSSIIWTIAQRNELNKAYCIHMRSRGNSP